MADGRGMSLGRGFFFVVGGGLICLVGLPVYLLAAHFGADLSLWLNVVLLLAVAAGSYCWYIAGPD